MSRPTSAGEWTSLILVVDDQERGREALAGLLEPEGYHIRFAASGAEALQQVRLLAPDLVLLDVMMPEMDGYEVCRRLRADHDLALVPIIMVTALDDQAAVLKGFEAGADDFVTKPFSRAELRARVRTITRLNRFRVLLEEQRRTAIRHAQLLWAIERSSEGYLLLDDHDRPRHGNAEARLLLDMPEESAGLPDMSFLSLAARRYYLEPDAAWATWPAPSPLTRHLVQPGGQAPVWIRVDLLDLPDSSQGYRLVHLRKITAQIQADRELWTFHSFMSHKLRTPLTGLLGGLSLLKRQLQHTGDEDVKMLSAIAHDGAQRLSEVVDNIFRYLQAPATAARGEGCPCALVPTLAAQLGATLGITDLSAHCDEALHDRRLILTSATLELLLAELLENARKFHPLQRPAVRITIGESGGKALISLADDGRSLTPEQLTQIWEPYHQVDEDFSGQIPGLGLGMAIVARTIWGAGGTCRVVNQATGPGLVVELSIPFEANRPCPET